MEWFFRLLDLVFVAGQVSACVGLIYGAYLSISHNSLPSIAGKSAAFSADGEPALS